MLALWIGVALALSPGDIPNPRPGGWVSDTAEVISPADEAAINERIGALNRDLGVEIAVVTVPSIDDGTPKQFTTELFNTWGVGSAERNDGLVVMLAVKQRRLEMETGYGLEGALPDGWLGVMQGQRMVPHFKKGDYGSGISAGLVAVDARLRGQDLPATVSPYVDRTHTPTPLPFNPVLVVGLTLLLVLVVSVLVLWNWRRQRTCPDHRVPLRPLPEDEEDAHLTAGQQTEEQLNSRRWDVFVCDEDGCEQVRTFGFRTLFSSYSMCPSCHNRTRTSDYTTEVYATRYSTGRARVTEDCAHCSYHNSYTKTLARLPEPSTSSSSSGGFSSGGGGGGGFGGGSSGGGGAGSSW